MIASMVRYIYFKLVIWYLQHFIIIMKIMLKKNALFYLKMHFRKIGCWGLDPN